MDKKKHVYNLDVMALPPLRLVIGDIPSPDPDRRNKSDQQMRKSSREMEGTVKRIIAHLEED
jgi:hypothetical protein